MTLSSTSSQKIIISLSNTEVLSAFGSYERLLTLDKGTRYALYSLIKEVISSNNLFDKKDKILAKIRPKRHEGCEIILLKETEEYILHFKSSLELENAITFLSKRKEITESSLYKTKNGYYLLLKSNHSLANISPSSKIEAEYIKEYAKPLIKKDAISVYKRIIKGF